MGKKVHGQKKVKTKGEKTKLGEKRREKAGGVSNKGRAGGDTAHGGGERKCTGDGCKPVWEKKGPGRKKESKMEVKAGGRAMREFLLVQGESRPRFRTHETRGVPTESQNVLNSQWGCREDAFEYDRDMNTLKNHPNRIRVFWGKRHSKDSRVRGPQKNGNPSNCRGGFWTGKS